MNLLEKEAKFKGKKEVGEEVYKARKVKYMPRFYCYMGDYK